MGAVTTGIVLLVFALVIPFLCGVAFGSRMGTKRACRIVMSMSRAMRCVGVGRKIAMEIGGRGALADDEELFRKRAQAEQTRYMRDLEQLARNRTSTKRAHIPEVLSPAIDATEIAAANTKPFARLRSSHPEV